MREITYPPEWVTADVVDSRSFYKGDVRLVGFLLADGTNCWTLVYEGGVRFLRTDGASLDVQTREVGKPTDAERDEVEVAWKALLAVDRHSAIKADAEIRRN